MSNHIIYIATHDYYYFYLDKLTTLRGLVDERFYLWHCGIISDFVTVASSFVAVSGIFFVRKVVIDDGIYKHDVTSSGLVSLDVGVNLSNALGFVPTVTARIFLSTILSSPAEHHCEPQKQTAEVYKRSDVVQAITLVAKAKSVKILQGQGPIFRGQGAQSQIEAESRP